MNRRFYVEEVDADVQDRPFSRPYCIDAEKGPHHLGLHQVFDPLRCWNELKLEGIVVGSRSVKLHPY